MTALLLLLVVALCGVPAAVVRGAVGFAVGWILGAATGVEQLALVGAVAFASFRYLLAVAAFADLGVVRRRWMRRMGSGQPLPEERQHVEAALRELRSHGAAMPARWAILGAEPGNSLVQGRTLLIGSEDVRSPYLLGVLAHEAGHLVGPVSDGRYTAGFNALVPRWLPKVVRAAVVLHGRRRELRADAYAHRLGFGAQLAEMMEANPSDGGHRWWWSLDRSHPPNARRVKRLRRLAARTVD